MPSCFLCSRTKSNKNKHITFHQLPKNEDLKKNWMKCFNECGADVSKITRYSKICSLHFDKDCFIKYSRTTLLKDDAVPSILVDRLKHAKIPVPEVIIPMTSISSTEIVLDGVEELPETDECTHSSPVKCPPSTSYSLNKRPMKATSLDMMVKAAVSDDDDTPRKKFLKQSITSISSMFKDKEKKVGVLNRKIKRQKKKIDSLKSIINTLKDNLLLNREQAHLLDSNFGKQKDLISNFAKKNAGEKTPKSFSMELRKFAITLNFYSPKGYQFVRREFNSVLPHPRTLSKWYARVDAEPGFTQESLNTLTIVCKNSQYPIYCALTMDEIAIRKSIEFDSSRGKYCGYVDYGFELDSDCVDEATECFVLMVIAINAAWKIPVGYFFCNHLNSEQKINLVRRCINVLTETGINVVSLTFDGCPVNVSMARGLNCKLLPNPQVIKTDFNVSDQDINVIFDPAHMIKLVRNTFGEKRVLIDCNNNVIDFKYVELLLMLQDTEKGHLANKLKKEHIFFFKNKMKVKLATQLLSSSVAKSLLFCKDVLQLNDFKDCTATINFIQLFNDAFDILNSRNQNSYGFKGAVNANNYDDIYSFIQKFYYYVNNLKLGDGQLVLKSQRSTGFLGFLICFKTLMNLKSSLIDTNKLKYLPFYKLSQDHLEIFYGSVRAQGGNNNNPTTRQFKSAYKKLLVNAQIKDSGLGNCLALQDIPILNCSSVSSNPVRAINESQASLYKDVQLESEVFTIENDGDHLDISKFSREIVIYVAGFVSHKLCTQIKCDICVQALIGDKGNYLNSLIAINDKGGLTYPSKDVIDICMVVEKHIKHFTFENKPLNSSYIQNKSLKSFINNKTIFSSIDFHNVQNGPFTNHIVLLIKSVISTFYNIKIKYLCKKQNEAVSLRSFYNKLTLFRGQ